MAGEDSKLGSWRVLVQSQTRQYTCSHLWHWLIQVLPKFYFLILYWSFFPYLTAASVGDTARPWLYFFDNPVNLGSRDLVTVGLNLTPSPQSQLDYLTAILQSSTAESFF